jgi:L-fuculose-phosphate aldolase
MMDMNKKEKIVNTAHHIYNKDMIIAKAGNISIIDENREYIYITASGTNFKHLKYDEIIKVKIDDLSYSGKKDMVPSMETSLHINIYKKRSDINSVVHVHSPYATGFAFSNKHLYQQEGFGEITGEYIKEVDYYRPGSDKLAKYTAIGLENENAVILKDHGVVTIGNNIEEATLLCEYIEGIAKTQYITHVLNL